MLPLSRRFSAHCLRLLSRQPGASPCAASRASFATEVTIPARVAARFPSEVTLDKGQKVAWCTCGVSKNQPFCDGSHRAYNEMHGVTPETGGFKPLIWEAPEDTFDSFCQCKKTEDPPFCDGSHNGLDESDGGAEDLIPVEFQNWEVLETTKLSHDTVLLRLKTDEEIGDAAESFHFSLRVDGKCRPYTPVRFDADTQEMDFVVKRYDSGMVSPAIHSLKAGDSVELRGPVPGEYSVSRSAGEHTELALFAAGTGITPILQIANACSALPTVPQINLFCCNKTDEDILCKDAADELGAVHVIEAKSAVPGCFEGRMSADILQANLPTPSSGSHAVVCGPPLFNRAVRDLLKGQGYTAEQITIC